MRNLTIKRTKSFVGCLVKMKIYIEDPQSNETVINDIPCRKIGELKSGEEKTFQIEDQAAKVFVIADQLSKNYCNEYYNLPDGQEDIYLSGKNKFNPANGNAFRFDNNENPEVLVNRKRGTRKGLLILLASAVIGVLAGYLIGSGLFSNQKSEEKTFSSSGMNITLTEEFIEADIENYTIAYDSKDVAVFALKEAFTLVDGFENYTLEQYGNLVINANGLDSAELKTVDGLTGFEYEFTNPETNDTYRYFAYVYKANDAFWLVQFATLNQNVETYNQQIIDWAKSVEFSN